MSQMSHWAGVACFSTMLLFELSSSMVEKQDIYAGFLAEAAIKDVS